MTIKCLHCGPLDVTDPAEVAHATAILDVLAVGGAPVLAITCPACREEVRAKDVIPGEVEL